MISIQCSDEAGQPTMNPNEKEYKECNALNYHHARVSLASNTATARTNGYIIPYATI